MSVKLIPLDFGGYELPQFKESKKGDWYEYGTDRPYKNTYPDYLTKLYNESSKHNQIINSKVKFIVGQGFSIEGNLSFTEKAYIEAFLRTPNEDENLDDLLAKLAKDKKVYGGFALQGKLAASILPGFSEVRSLNCATNSRFLPCVEYEVHKTDFKVVPVFDGDLAIQYKHTFGDTDAFASLGFTTQHWLGVRDFFRSTTLTDDHRRRLKDTVVGFFGPSFKVRVAW